MPVSMQPLLSLSAVLSHHDILLHHAYWILQILLAQDCDLTIMQINNWFINARRRLINRPPKRGAAVRFRWKLPYIMSFM